VYSSVKCVQYEFTQGMFWIVFSPPSASVALAVVLVVGILAVLAVLGYFFLKNRRKNHQHQRVATNSPPVALGEEHQQMVYNSTTAKA